MLINDITYEMEKVLERHKLPKVTQELGMDNITRKEFD